jgi:N-acetylglucosaminyl-diphospho-decaprenol L-rhamnosyltransferase
VSDLVIVIVNYNAAADLERCLRSLHDTPARVTHEIVVVDNASTDGSVDGLPVQWPKVRLIQAGGNLGFARANNLGARNTCSELVLLLNNDTIVPPGAIDTLVTNLRAQGEAAIAGPRIVDGQGKVEVSFGRMMGPWNELRQKLLVRAYERSAWVAGRVEAWTRLPRVVDWVSGACLLVRRTDAEAVGWLDERYFLYAEDVDFCASVRARGRAVLFCPDAQIVHMRGRSRSNAPTLAERAYRESQLAFYAKHHPRWQPWLRRYLRVRGRWPV